MNLRLVAVAFVASAMAAACGTSPDVDTSSGELIKPDADAAPEIDTSTSNDAAPADAAALDAIVLTDADVATDAFAIDAADCTFVSSSDAGFCWHYGLPNSYRCPDGPIHLPDPSCINSGGFPDDGGSVLCCP